MNKKHSLYLWGFITLICIGIVFADSVRDMETLDGAQRNRLADIISASSGGSGSGSFTNGTSTFSGNFVSTNGVNGSITNYLSAINVYQRAADTFYLNFISTNAGTVAGILLGSGAGDTIQLKTSSGNADLNLNNTTAALSFMAGKYAFDANGAVFNANLSTTGTMTGNSNVTFGNFSGNTITFNGSTLTAPNTLNVNSSTFWVSNSVAAFGTNTAASTEALRIQASGAANATGLTVVGGAAGSAVPIQAWKTANGSTVSQIASNGVFLIGGGSVSATGMNGVNNGGTVSFVNNTATASSITDVGGGTGPTSKVTLSASSTKIGSFTTNIVNLNGMNVTVTTNSTTMGPFLMVSGNLIPGSIAANGTYTTNFALANAVTNGAYMIIKPPQFENVNIRYDVSSPSNGFVTLYLHNEDLVSAHTATNGTYGAAGIMPSL